MSEPRKFDEALRESLRAEGAPAELRSRLMAEARRQDAGRRFTLRPYLAAAALLLTLGSGIYLGRGLRTGTPVAASALPDLLEATSKNYRTIQGLDFSGRECTDKACGIWALNRVGFTAPLPACMEGASMIGGRSCAVQGRPVAHYAFRDGRAVYVFAGPLEGCAGTPGDPRKVEGPYLARAWNEGGRGYVLLEPGR